MATAIQWRRGTTAQHSSFTGLVGEITVDTDLDTLRVHDGSTAGGHRLAKYSEIGDITAVTAGDGLSGGGTSGALSIALDLNELTAATVAVDADSIAIIDAGDNSSKKESIADFVSAIAGSGLSASSGQLSISETGDISAVTAGDGLSGGGSSGAVSLALDLNELTAATIDVAGDSFPIIDASDNSTKKEAIADFVSAIAGTNLTATNGVLSTTADLTGVTAGDGLSGGGTSGAVSLALDLNELTAATVDVANDSIAIIDAGDSSSKKEAIADLVSAMAGTNLTATNGVLSTTADITGVTAGDGLSGGGTSGALSLALDLNELTAATVDVANDLIPIIDASDNSTKKESLADIATAMAGTGIDASSGVLAVDSTVVVTTGTQTVGGNKTFSNDIVVTGNFTVNGTTTTINTETLALEDNNIVLNNGTSGSPTENAGLTVDRGSSTDVVFQFNETSDKWQFTNDGSTYFAIATGTDELAEGSTNLYFTNTRADARADARFAVQLAASDTGDLSEGSNLYYTDERVMDKVGARLSGSGNISVTYDDAADTITVSEALTTTDITEGDNLYYTNARADARITAALIDEDDLSSDSATRLPSQQSVKAYVDAQVAGKDNTDEITEGSSNLYFTNARADARITNALLDEDNMASNSATKVPSQQSVKAYVDAQVDTADALSELSGDSDDVTEGSTNLFFTNARAQAAITVTDAGGDGSLGYSSGTITYTGPATNTLIDARVDTAFVNALNVNATTLDSIDSGSFLRSDANDSHSGDITPGSDNAVDLGTGSLRYAEIHSVLFSGVASSAKYADLAEKYTTDEELDAGTVVCFGGEAEITACEHECDHRVAGVISTDPAYMMNSEGEGQYLALTGRVPTKVTGPVAKGDLLVSSSVKGHAMVDNNAQPGRIIGKAVGSNESGEGVIEVLVNMM